jgi:hypothetical protein
MIIEPVRESEITEARPFTRTLVKDIVVESRVTAARHFSRIFSKRTGVLRGCPCRARH